MTDTQAQTSKWTVLVIVALGVFMASLDSSVVNISLPAIGRYFGLPLCASVEWVIIAYLLVIASLLLSVGRFSDLVGRKRVWSAGLLLFTLGSALCGLAPSLALLVAFRVMQGVGAAMLMAISPAMLTAAFPPHERGRAIGLNAVFVAVGVSAGPALGGLITEHLSWRWIFYINLPVGSVALLATVRWLPDTRPRGVGRFDPAGAVLMGTGLAAITGALTLGGEAGWSSPFIPVALAVGVLVLAAFLYVEARSTHPVLDLSLFSNRVFASANASLVLSFLAMFAIGFMMPFYLEELRGFSPAQAGLLLTPLPVALAVVAPLSGSLADRVGTRWLTFVGMVVCSLALLWVGSLRGGSSPAEIVLSLALAGVGQGLFQSPNNSALLGAAPRGSEGAASGILATGRVVGQSLSVALAGALFTSSGGAAAGRALSALDASANQLAAQRTFEAGFRTTLWVCAAVAAIGAIATLVRGADRVQPQFAGQLRP